MDLSRRLRPADVDPKADFSDNFFRCRVGIFGKGSSFPSDGGADLVVSKKERKRWEKTQKELDQLKSTVADDAIIDDCQ